MSKGSKEHSLEKLIKILEIVAVELRSGRELAELVQRRFTAAEKGKQKESEQPILENTPT